MNPDRQHQAIGKPRRLTHHVEMTIGNGIEGAREKRDTRHRRGLTRTASNRKTAWRVHHNTANNSLHAHPASCYRPGFGAFSLQSAEMTLNGRVALYSAAAAMSALLGAVSPTFAQNAPTDRELQVYAGLHAAAANGDVAEIERLIADGENPNLQDANSRTPLIVAVFRGHHVAAQELLRLGAKPNAMDLQRYDIVTIAAVQNDLEMLKLALAGGASPRNIISQYDGTALIAAAHLGHVEIVRTLIAAGAPLDHVNNLGWTALIEAIVLGNGSKNHVDTVEALVKAGADVDIKDRHGSTALDHARQRGYTEMVKILTPASGRRT